MGGTEHSIITMGQIEDVECPEDGEEFRYCPYCGSPLQPEADRSEGSQ